MLEHKYKVMISGSAFRLYEEGANHITVPHCNTLIGIKYVAYISMLRILGTIIKRSSSKTFKASIHPNINVRIENEYV